MKLLKLMLTFLLVYIFTLNYKFVNADCESCKGTNIPCLKYIWEGIEKYCSKSGDTTNCYCDWV